MQRRDFLIAAGLAGLGVGLTGCSQSGPQSGPAKSLAFFNDAASWEPGYVDAGAVLQQQMGWSLTPQTIPNASSYEQVVRSRLQTQNPPDIVKWGSGYRMQDLARTGTLASLDDAWTTAVSRGWLSDDLHSEFTYNGAIYGLPLIQGFYVMFYNTKLFAELGIAVPTTWDSFIDAADQLKKAGVTPIGTTQVNIWPVANWFSVLSASFDPEWYRKVCANQASFLDEPARNMIQLWTEMIGKGYFTSADANPNNFPSMLQTGAIGMYPTAVSWSTQSLERTGMVSGADFDCFILPSFDGGSPAVITEVAGLVVPSSSQNLGPARDAMSHWLGPKVQQPWSDFLNGSSANPNVKWPDPVSRRIQQKIMDEDLTVLNRYWENSPPPLVVGNTQDLGGFMASPSSPISVLESMQRRAETEWSYWNEATS